MTTTAKPWRLDPPKSPRQGGQANPSGSPITSYQPGAPRSRTLVYHEGADKRRRLGSIEQRPEGLTFTRTLHRSRHLHRVLNSWGLQVAVLDELRAAGISIIEVVDADTRIVYYAPLARLQSEGIRRTFPPHGPQVFLPLPLWDTPAAHPRLPGMEAAQ